MAFPHQRAGSEAARVLHEHLTDDELSYSRVYLRSWLVCRESTAHPRFEAIGPLRRRRSDADVPAGASLRAES